MRIHAGALLLLFSAVACGGASESDDGSESRVGNRDDTKNEDAGSGQGSGKDDDDADDDTSDDDADDDVSSDDDVTEDDDTPPSDDDVSADDDVSTDDDVSADDDVPGPNPMPTMTPGPIGTTPPAPTMTPGPGPTPVEGCMLVSQSSSSTTCEIREQCSNAYKYTYCSELATGGWTCSCSDGFSGYELEVSSDEAPCQTVKDVCGTFETPTFTGEYTCEPQSKSTNVDYCEIQTRCVEAAPVNDQISVVQSQYFYTSCYSDGQGGLSCNCSGLEGAKSFSLTGVGTDTACTAGAALCDPAAMVELVGEETCTVGYESTSTTYCQLQQTCAQAVTVNGVEANLTETQTGNCSTDAAGATTCSCYNNSRSYSFPSEAPADAAGVCADAIAVCEITDDPVPTGPIECGSNSQSASTSSCNASTTCTQEATVGDAVINLYGSLYTYCQQNGDVWACQCQSGSATVPFEVSAADAWDACTDASAQCPDLVEVQLSANGNNPCYYGRPVPMAGVGGGAGADAPGAPIPCYR